MTTGNKENANPIISAVSGLLDALVSRRPDTSSMENVREVMNETAKYITALQEELDSAKAFLDEASAHCAWVESDREKWKARFEWLAKTTCAAVSCGRFGYCNNGCNGFDTWREVLNHIAAYADKEIKK